MSRMSINYTPELVDAAIKEHIKNHMNVTGVEEIDYMHRRKTKKVSATIYVGAVTEETPGVTQGYEEDSPYQPEDCRDEDDAEASYITGDTTDLEGAVKAITFDDLPEHEKEEARETQDALDESDKQLELNFDAPEDEEKSMFDNLPNQKSEDSKDEANVEDLFG